MRFNLVSNLSEQAEPTQFCSYNHIIAYSLKKALTSAGHEAVLVSDKQTQIPIADHAIVISNFAMNRVLREINYHSALKAASRGLLCLWLDSDFGDWKNHFDRVLTVNRRGAHKPEVFRYVGWAADSSIFFPEQSGLAVYVDPYMRGFYGCRFDSVYDEIQRVVESSGIEFFQPVFQYNAGRVPWVTVAGLLRKSSFFVVTQLGKWDLMNIEAATCGALLVVHKRLDRPDTYPSPLNHRVYSSPEELLEILREPVDVAANRAVALENTWAKVVDRVLEAVA